MKKALNLELNEPIHSCSKSETNHCSFALLVKSIPIGQWCSSLLTFISIGLLNESKEVCQATQSFWILAMLTSFLTVSTLEINSK